VAELEPENKLKFSAPAESARSAIREIASAATVASRLDLQLSGRIGSLRMRLPVAL